jgi:heat shock protein HslJ
MSGPNLAAAVRVQTVACPLPKEVSPMSSLARSCVAVGLIGVMAFGAVGCAAASGAPDLEGTNWVLTAWSVSSASATDFKITLTFTADTLGGQAPVNSYSGEYAAGGLKFTTGEITQTLMAGPEPAMEAETLYFELLAQAETYTLEGDVLTLRGAGGSPLLVFERASR